MEDISLVEGIEWAALVLSGVLLYCIVRDDVVGII